MWFRDSLGNPIHNNEVVRQSAKPTITSEDAMEAWKRVGDKISEVKELEQVENNFLKKIEEWKIMIDQWRTVIKEDNVSITKTGPDSFLVNTDKQESGFPEFVIDREWNVITTFSDIFDSKHFDEIQKITWITEKKVWNDYIYTKDGKEVPLLSAYSQFKKELMKIEMRGAFPKSPDLSYLSYKVGEETKGNEYLTEEGFKEAISIMIEGIDRLGAESFDFTSDTSKGIMTTVGLLNREALEKLKTFASPQIKSVAN